MAISRLRSVASLAIVVVVLFIAIAAKTPTSACHCHDSKPQSQKDPCPFGKLRTLLGSLTILTPVEITDDVVVIVESVAVAPVQRSQQIAFDNFMARAPPV